MEKKSGWYNERLGLIFILVGLGIFVAAWLFMDPLGTSLGPSESPGRVALLNIEAFLFCLPWAVYWMYKFAKRPDWLAMPGRYIEGMK